MSVALQNIPLFSGLTDQDVQSLLKLATPRRFAKSVAVIREGAEGESLFIVIEGKVKVYLNDDNGKEIILSVLGPGDFIGELALIDDDARSASVMTMEPSEFLVLPKQAFRDHLRKNPDLAMNMLRVLATRLRGADQMIGSLALMDVFGRVARTLTQLAKPSDGRMVVTDRYTQQDIANMVGASREMVSRIFRDLTMAGLIQVEHGQIVVNESPRQTFPSAVSRQTPRVGH